MRRVQSGSLHQPSGCPTRTHPVTSTAAIIFLCLTLSATACRSTTTPEPTSTPTQTPTITPGPTTILTNTQSPVQGTHTPAPCICDYNAYNCCDFPTHADAQACYLHCKSVGAGDVHWIDADEDGSACELLP